MLATALLAATLPLAASPAYENAVQQARAFFESNDYPAARKSLDAAVAASETPEEKAETFLRVGKTYEKEKNIVKAREAFQQVLTVAGATTKQKMQARAGITGGYLQEKRFPEAREQTALIIAEVAHETDSKEESPEDRKIAVDTLRLGIAATYEDEGKPDVAETEYAKIANDDQITPALRWTAQINTAEFAFKRGDFTEARARFVKASQFPGINIALVGAAQGRIVDTYAAQGNVTQTDIVSAGYQTALVNKATAFYNAKQWEQARACYGAAVLVAGPLGNPAAAAMYRLKIADIYAIEGQFKRSNKELQDVLDFIAKTKPTTRQPKILDGLQLMEQMTQRSLAVNFFKQDKNQQGREALEKMLKQPDLRPDVRAIIEHDLTVIQ